MNIATLLDVQSSGIKNNSAKLTETSETQQKQDFIKTMETNEEKAMQGNMAVDKRLNTSADSNLKIINMGTNALNLASLDEVMNEATELIGNQFQEKAEFEGKHFPGLTDKDFIEIIANVALNAIETTKNNKNIGIGQIDRNSIDSLVTHLEQLQKLLKEFDESVSNETGLRDISQLLDQIKMELEEEEFTIDIKEIATVLSEIKTAVYEMKGEYHSTSNAKSSEILNKIRDLEMKFDSMIRNKDIPLMSEVVEIIKKDIQEESTLEIDLDKVGAADVKEIETVAEGTENTPVSTDEINGASQIRTDSVMNEKKVMKEEKPQQLTLEQMRSKLSDKIENIQKMSISKDKILINLNPKNLGNVEILFKKSADGLEVAIEFDEKNTKVALESMFDEMKREFKERNIEFNFIFKERNREQENSERKNEYFKQERNIENENSEDFNETFEQIMERVLRGE